MRALKGLDASQELTRHAAALRTQNFDFVIRYYSNNASKNLSLGEARVLSGARLLIGVVWETQGTQASFFNRSQGVADGAAACHLAQTVIGQPPGSAIYFAVDYDATGADLNGPISEYFDGVQAAFQAHANGPATYLIGVYGSGLVCGTLLDSKRASLSWLSQSTGFTGSKEFASARRYNLIQSLPTSIKGGGGATLGIDPDASNPALPHGLFSVGAAGGAA